MTDLRSAALPPVGSDDHVRGDPGAPLVIVYADFTCPHCAVAHDRLRGVPVRVVFRHFALKSRDPRALALACAAEAASLQDAFWAMHDSLFADPGRVDDPHLWERARRLSLDLARFEADRRLGHVAGRVTRDLHGALRAGVTATPTLFVEGRAHPGAPDPDLLAALGRG